jgi:hypothetical protein
MATSATAPKARASKKSNPTAPKRWWQQILLYPAFAVALVTAGPQWLDTARGWKLGVKSAAESDKQAQLWMKNATCAANPAKGFLSPRNVTVDATICDSGDILVRAVTMQNTPIYKWLPLDDVVRANAAGSFIPAAQAATLSANVRLSPRTVVKPSTKLAMLQASVLCTKANGRYLTRRIQTPQGCFDEVIDTFTGAVVSRNPAPCTSQC